MYVMNAEAKQYKMLLEGLTARWIDEVGHVLHSQLIDEVREYRPNVNPGCHTTSYQQGGQTQGTTYTLASILWPHKNGIGKVV